MSSNISSIYSTLAAKSFTVNDKAVTGKTGTDVPNQVSGSEPVRVLTSLSEYLFENVSDAQVWQTDVGGTVKQMTWQIADLLLVGLAGSNTGPGQFEAHLQGYIKDYADMLASDTALASLGAMSVLPTWACGIYEYPPQSGRWFYGVLVNLTIVEKWS